MIRAETIERQVLGMPLKEYLALEKPPASWIHGYIPWANLPAETKRHYREADKRKATLIDAFYEELDQLLKEKR